MNDTFYLPEDPEEAVRDLREASRETPVLLFKRSPVCGVSRNVESELGRLLEKRGDAGGLLVVRLNVLSRKALARGITDLLGIAHASPQMVIFKNGEVCWHGSHYALSEATLDDYL